MTGKIRVLDYSLENPASLRVRERKREREKLCCFMQNFFPFKYIINIAYLVVFLPQCF